MLFRTVLLLGLLLALPTAPAAQPDAPSPWDALELELPAAAESAVPRDLPTEATRVLDEDPAPAATTIERAGEDQPIARTAAAARRASGEPKPAVSTGWVRSTLALVAVVALIGLLAWGYRTVTGNASLPLGRPRRPGVLEVIARATLGPRQSLCLVRCGPRMVLVGLSGDQVSALDVISDPNLVADLAGEQLRSAAGADPFDALLGSEARAYDEPDIDETAGPEEGALRATKRRLTETIERIRAARQPERSEQAVQ